VLTDDITIAGTTLSEGHDEALAQVMAEWTSERSSAARIDNLRGTGTGSAFAKRSSGGAFLSAGGDSATVPDDEATDLLTGPEGQDWFFANLGAGVWDRLTDLSAREFADDLDFMLGSCGGTSWHHRALPGTTG
jgi:hypothetical protein